jgi:hypothetical protein
LRVTVEPVRREHQSRFVELVRQFQRDLSHQVSRRLPDG